MHVIIKYSWYTTLQGLFKNDSFVWFYWKKIYWYYCLKMSCRRMWWQICVDCAHFHRSIRNGKSSGCIDWFSMIGFFQIVKFIRCLGWHNFKSFFSSNNLSTILWSIFDAKTVRTVLHFHWIWTRVCNMSNRFETAYSYFVFHLISCSHEQFSKFTSIL